MMAMGDGLGCFAERFEPRPLVERGKRGSLEREWNPTDRRQRRSPLPDRQEGSASASDGLQKPSLNGRWSDVEMAVGSEKVSVKSAGKKSCESQ